MITVGIMDNFFWKEIGSKLKVAKTEIHTAEVHFKNYNTLTNVKVRTIQSVISKILVFEHSKST